jgi:hypothetical protein
MVPGARDLRVNGSVRCRETCVQTYKNQTPKSIVTVKDTNPLIAEDLIASRGLIFCDPQRFPFWSGRTYRSSA